MTAARRALARITGARPATILATAWGLLLVYAYPGLMTQDSYDHMREARAGIYSDAHPPAVNVLWKLCDYVIAGPTGFLLVQTGLLLAGLYAIFRSTFTERRAAWWAAAVFVFPPVLCVMVVIWKDCIMAALLVVGIAGLLSEARTRRLAGLAAMCGATAMRYNAFGATLPLIVLLFEWRPGQAWITRYAISTATWLAVTLAAFGINKGLTDRPMHYWASSLAIYDIAGTLAFVDEDLPDDAVRARLEGTQFKVTSHLHDVIRHVYTPRDFFPILGHPDFLLWDLPINGYDPAPEAQRDAIGHAWKATITDYPLAYAKHRLSVMAKALDLSSTRRLGAIVSREFRYPEFAQAQGLSTGWSKLQLKMTRWMRWLARHTPLFTPWVWLLVAVLLLPLALRQRDVLALLLSGLAMEGTLLLLVHSRDYRYSHWMVVTTIVAAILLGARRARAGRASSPAATGV